MKEMNGVQPFVYLLTCGCVFTQAGLRTVSIAQPKEKSESGADSGPELEICPQCAVKFSPADDIITLNPSEEEDEVLRAKMEQKRLLEPPKKGKKRKNGASPEESDPPAKKQAVQPSLNPNIAAASRAVVSGLASEEAKRKATMSDAVKSLYGNADGKKRKETFMTMGTFTRVRPVSFAAAYRTNVYPYSMHEDDYIALLYYINYDMDSINTFTGHSWFFILLFHFCPHETAILYATLDLCGHCITLSIEQTVIIIFSPCDLAFVSDHMPCDMCTISIRLSPEVKLYTHVGDQRGPKIVVLHRLA